MTGEGAAPVAAPASMSPTLLAYAVGPIALVVLLALRQFGLVAEAPIWLYAAAILVPVPFVRLVERWEDVLPGSWRFHVRVALHVAQVTLVIYVCGWGPALGMAFAFSALIDLQLSGAAAWRGALWWSVAGCGIGQLLVFVGWMPSFLSGPQAQTIGVLGAFVFGIAIRMAGAIGERKEQAEELLACQATQASLARDEARRSRDDARRSEALHRAVVENAAEGIFTVGSDGLVLSFNAAAEAMFGWSASKIVGQPGVLLLAPEMHEHLATYFETVQSLGHNEAKHGTWEVSGARSDGTYFPMAISTSAIWVDGFQPITCCLARDMSDQKDLETQLSYQALHDALTDLPNRTLLIDRLDQALARSRRHHRMCGVLYVDLDRFKVVNDTLGHAAGDLLLVEAAKRIRGAIREKDTVARLGGDEFVVLCEDLDSVHDASDLAERIGAALHVPFCLGEDSPQVDASIGIALSADGTETADMLLGNADIAMYRAKDNGRNCHELFDEAMQHWVTTQLMLETALRGAIGRNELRVHYQPIVSGSSATIRGFEALVRWERPGHGLVAPDQFIPVAEDTGMIVEIGAWVLAEACRQAATWAHLWPDRHLGVSVNVSSRQLATRDIVDLVTDTLASTNLDPARLTLELTESTLIDDAINAQAILREIRGLGVNLSLDDFGTGYSSLTYLRAFPINVVKIDKSFVRTLGTERQDTAIVAAVLALAKNLDISVVAEGVETREQLAVLLHLQCPYLQGYLFSRPRPADLLVGLIESGLPHLAATHEANP